MKQKAYYIRWNLSQPSPIYSIIFIDFILIFSKEYDSVYDVAVCKSSYALTAYIITESAVLRKAYLSTLSTTNANSIDDMCWQYLMKLFIVIVWLYLRA